MSSERYYQEPETVVSNSDKQYGTIDKNSLENIKPVTNSLKDSNTRHLLESKLQQGLEDLNLINEKVKLKKHNSLRLLKQQQKPNLSIHPNTNIAASEVVHLQKQYPQHQKSVSNSNSLSPLHTQNSSNSKSSPNFNNFSTISANTSTENTPQNYPKQINSDSLSMSRIDSGHQSVSLNSPENVNLDQSPDTVTVMSHLSRSRPGTINLQNDSSPERQQQYASMAYKNQSFSAHGSPYNFTAAPSNNPLIVPINDLRITECESEKMHEHRCKLASLYRLVHLYKWDHEILAMVLKSGSNLGFSGFLGAFQGLLRGFLGDFQVWIEPTFRTIFI